MTNSPKNYVITLTGVTHASLYRVKHQETIEATSQEEAQEIAQETKVYLETTYGHHIKRVRVEWVG